MFKWSAIGDQVSQDIDAQISILHHQGFKYIEIRKINTKFLYEHDYKFIMELGEKLKHVGMRCSCISTDIGKNKDVNYDVFFRSVDYAKFLKVHYIRVFGYFFTKNKECANRALRYAKKSNVLVLVENEYKTNVETPEDVSKLMKEFDNIELLFDAGNAYRSGRNYKVFLQKAYGYISYIHLKDIRLKGNKQIGTYIGNGKLEVIKMLNDLYRYGYNGFISLEPYVYLKDNPRRRKKIFIKYWKKINEKVVL